MRRTHLPVCLGELLQQLSALARLDRVQFAQPLHGRFNLLGGEGRERVLGRSDGWVSAAALIADAHLVVQGGQKEVR